MIFEARFLIGFRFFGKAVDLLTFDINDSERKQCKKEKLLLYTIKTSYTT